MNEIVTALVDCVRGMAPSHARALASAIERAASADEAHHAATTAVPNATYRQQASQILRLWERHPEMSGATLALALHTAVELLEQEHAAEVVEVVATGPSSPHVALRQTKAVLLSLIDEAQREVIVTSYAAYQVPDLVSALQRAANRGVLVRLILETKADSRGVLTFDAAHAFRSLSGVELFAWPLEQREHGGRLHAKTAVADSSVAFVTSANLTGSAMEENLEVGVLLRGGQSPARLTEHFHALIASGVLRRV